MKEYDAIVVANKIIDYYNNVLERDINMQVLHKLLYICQGYNITLRGHRMFRDDIKAGLYGPVVSGKLYKKIKHYRMRHISKPIWTLFKKNRDISQLEHDDNRMIELVCDNFGERTGIQLSVICRATLGGPWRRYTDDGRNRIGSNIPIEFIKTFFEE